MKFQPVLRGQLGDKCFVSVRSLAAQFVIEVHHAEHKSQLLAQFQQQEQERHRIRASGHRNAHTIPRTHEFVRFQVLHHLLAQRQSHG